jgi:ADP-L-glycero-D-manno-heptose 6-epimerase
MSRKILITGGAGFIGSNLAMYLQEQYPDDEITVLDLFPNNKSFKNLIGFRGLVVAGSVTYTSFTDSQYDVVYHLASNTDTTDEYLEGQIENNIVGFERVTKAKTPLIIYASSASVYGNPSHSNPMKETDPVSPQSAYAFTKQQLENIARWDRSKTYVGLRFFNVYGPREDFKGSATSMVTKILSSVKHGKELSLFKPGTQRRDFIYVKDVVELLAKVGEEPKAGVFNVGTGVAVSFNEIVQSAVDVNANKTQNVQYIPLKYEFFQEHTQADLTKTTKAFGWSPKWSLGPAMLDYVHTV